MLFNKDSCPASLDFSPSPTTVMLPGKRALIDFKPVAVTLHHEEDFFLIGNWGGGGGGAAGNHDIGSNHKCK